MSAGAMGQPATASALVLAGVLAVCCVIGRWAADLAPSFVAQGGDASFPMLRGAASGRGHAAPMAPALAQWVTAALATTATASATAAVARLARRPCRTIMRGLKDRVKKDFTVKSAMIRKLGKWVLQKEFDMRAQIEADPKMASRQGMTKEQLLGELNRAVDYLKSSFNLDNQVAEISISKVATGLNMQHLGKPNIPQNQEMDRVCNWLCNNLAVSREDGTLKRVVENYPFVLGRSLEELEASKKMCPEDITFQVAVAEDPALIDKTYNCNGICASQCVACWYNG